VHQAPLDTVVFLELLVVVEPPPRGRKHGQAPKTYNKASLQGGGGQGWGTRRDS